MLFSQPAFNLHAPICFFLPDTELCPCAPAALDKQKEVEAQLQALSLEHREHNERLEKGRGLVQVSQRRPAKGSCAAYSCNAWRATTLLAGRGAGAALTLAPLVGSCVACRASRQSF